jgi:hypothetical protein
MKFLLFISALITFFSCSDINKGEQLKAIENIQKSIDSVETVLIETSFDEVDRYFKEAIIVQSRIKENYNSDTISMDLAIKLDKYKNLVLKTPILQKSYAKIVKDTESFKTSVAKLYLDIENGNGNRAEYDKYITDELENIKLLRELLVKYHMERKYLIENYQLLHDVVYNFSFDLITN